MIDLIVCSPPFMECLESKDEKFQAKARPGRTIQCATYGKTEGQLGAMKEGIFNLIEDTMNKEKTRECVFDEWTSCYGESWQGVIVEDAFAH